MNLTKIYKKGNSEINDDACVVNEKAGIFAAIDGATGLNGVPGHVASNVIRKQLEAASGQAPLYDVIKAANHKVGKATVDAYQKHVGELDIPDIEEVAKTQRSAAGMAAIQLDKDHLSLQYVHAGDCMLFLQYEDNTIRTVSNDLVQYLDEKAILEMGKLRKENKAMDLADAREKVKPMLFENRNKMNATGGYGVIDGSEAALNYLEYGKISLNKVTGILLVSDGLQLPTEVDENDAWEQTAAIAFSQGLQGLGREVEQREKKDPECVRYPRLKMEDDKTGVMARLG